MTTFRVEILVDSHAALGQLLDLAADVKGAKVNYHKIIDVPHTKNQTAASGDLSHRDAVVQFMEALAIPVCRPRDVKAAFRLMGRSPNAVDGAFWTLRKHGRLKKVGKDRYRLLPANAKKTTTRKRRAKK